MRALTPRILGFTGSATLVLGLLGALAGCSDTGLTVQPGSAPPTRVDAVIEVFGDNPDEPHLVDFGEVQVGTTVERDITIRNIGTDTLQIQDVLLEEGGAFSAFQLVNLDELVPLLTPDTAWVLRAAYAPSQDEARDSILTVASNDRESPEVNVRLIGQGLGPAIDIFPPSFDYGNPEIGCVGSETFTISNIGRADLTIGDISLEDLGGSGELQVDPSTVPVLPLVLAPNESFDVDVFYTPTNVEPDTSILHVQSDDPAEPDATASQYGIAHLGDTKIDEFAQEGDNSTDILWVVDNSCSMGEEQTSLAANFSAFMTIIEALSVDYQIGVTTTDIGDNGGLQGSVPIVTPTTPDPAVQFSANVNLGVNGSPTEQGLLCGQLALDSAMAGPGGPNEAFLRPDAGLRLMLVSDEPEQSPGTPQSYVSFFQGLKANPEHVVLSDITGGLLGCNGPGGDAQNGTGYVEATVLTGGISASICDANWSSTLSALAWLSQSFADTFELSDTPVQDTVEVILNGVNVYVGWIFDPALNAVIFDPDHIPENGDFLEIQYTILGACNDNTP